MVWGITGVQYECVEGKGTKVAGWGLSRAERGGSERCWGWGVQYSKAGTGKWTCGGATEGDVDIG